MKEKTFNHYMNGRRPITVKIHDDIVTFHYTNEGDREFYGFAISAWKADRTERLDRDDNWHTHINKKAWFSKEMYDFIEKNV